MARASKGILMDSSNPESSKIVLRLDRLMVERQFSLNELAEKVGITNANLSKIKNNHITAMRFSTLAALCEILDCEVGDLIEYVK
jgi:putative transcriptional regulator